MIPSLRKLFFAIVLVSSLAACEDEKAISSSSGGSSTGDSGTGSSQYAGQYQGVLNVQYSGDDISGSDSFPTTVTVNTNGTVSLTIDGETVGGVINGNQIEVKLRLTQTENGVECKGDVTITATVQGNSLSGPASGSATCKLITLSRNATLSGSLSASKG